ncbi:hypothetical protein ACOMHN_042153 [Nucella lapillus]
MERQDKVTEEEFPGEERRRAAVVPPASHQPHPPPGSAGPQPGSLTIQTSGPWDTTAHNVTHSSMVTSGYDSGSASTDVSFSSPFISPEQESNPFFDGGGGAQGMSLGWGEEYPLSGHGFQGGGHGYFMGGRSGDSSGWQQAAGGSMQTSMYSFDDPAILFSSLSTPPVATSDIQYREDVEAQLEDTDYDYDLRDLPSASFGVTMQAELDPDIGDYSASAHTAVGSSSVGEPVTSDESKTEDKSAQGEHSPNVFTDRGERFILSEELPKAASIVVSRHQLALHRDRVAATSKAVASTVSVELRGGEDTSYTESVPTKLSSYSTTVNTGRDTAISVVSDSSLSPGTVEHTGIAAAPPVVSVLAEFSHTVDRHSPVPQTMGDRETDRAVTAEEVLQHHSDEEMDTTSEVPSSQKTVTDTKQTMNKNSTKTAENTEEDDSLQSPRKVSKTRYSAHFKTSTPRKDEHRKHSDPETPSSPTNEEQRYLSTLYIASGQSRTAETRLDDTERDSDYNAKDRPDGVSSGSRTLSSMSFLTKPCSATFDVGRLRSPTPIRLTGGQWGQVIQIATPFMNDNGGVSSENITPQATSKPASERVKEERDESVARADTLVMLTEECRDSGFSVDTMGGDQTNSALCETGIAGGGDGGEGRQGISVTEVGSISKETPSHRTSRLFSPADEEPGKLCYFSHISDDEAEDDDEDSRAVSCLDISVRGYNTRGDFTEHSSSYQLDKTVEEQKRETSTISVQLDNSSTQMRHYKTRNYVEKEPDREQTLFTESEDSAQHDDSVNRKEPDRHTQHLTQLFDYSNVHYLQQEQHSEHVCPADGTAKYSVLEFKIKSKPPTVAVNTGDIVATAGVYEMNQTEEETVVDSGESTLLVMKTEDIRDESPAATTTLDNVQGVQDSQFAACLDGSAQKWHQEEKEKEGEEEEVEDQKDTVKDYASELLTKEVTEGEDVTTSKDWTTADGYSTTCISGGAVTEEESERGQNPRTDHTLDNLYHHYVDREEEFVNLFCRPMIKREEIAAFLPADQVKPEAVDADETGVKGKGDEEVVLLKEDQKDGKRVDDGSKSSTQINISLFSVDDANAAVKKEDVSDTCYQYADREEEFVSLFCRPMLKREHMAAFLPVDQVKPEADETGMKGKDEEVVLLKEDQKDEKRVDENGSKSSTETETSLLSMDETTTSTVEIQQRMELTSTVTDASTNSQNITETETSLFSMDDANAVVSKDGGNSMDGASTAITQEDETSDTCYQYVEREEEFVSLFCRPMLKREHMAAFVPVDQVMSGDETGVKSKDEEVLVQTKDQKDEKTVDEDGSKSSPETETSLLSMDNTTTSTVEIQQQSELTTTVTDASTKSQNIIETETSLFSMDDANAVISKDGGISMDGASTAITKEDETSDTCYQYVEREEEFVSLFCRPMLKREHMTAFLPVDQVKPEADETGMKGKDEEVVLLKEDQKDEKRVDENGSKSSTERETSFLSMDDSTTSTLKIQQRMELSTTVTDASTKSQNITETETSLFSMDDANAAISKDGGISMDGASTAITQEDETSDTCYQYVEREEEFVSLFCRPMLKREHMAAFVPVDQVMSGDKTEVKSKDEEVLVQTKDQKDEKTVDEDGSKSSPETETSLLSMDDSTTSTVEIQQRSELSTTVTDASTKSQNITETETSLFSMDDANAVVSKDDGISMDGASAVISKDDDISMDDANAAFTKEDETSDINRHYADREEEFVNLFCRPMLKREHVAAFLPVDQVMSADETGVKSKDEEVLVQTKDQKDEKRVDEDRSQNMTETATSLLSMDDTTTSTVEIQQRSELSTTVTDASTKAQNITETETSLFSMDNANAVVSKDDGFSMNDASAAFTKEDETSDITHHYADREEEFVNLFCRPILKREHMAAFLPVDQVKPAVAEPDKTEKKDTDVEKVVLLKDDQKDEKTVDEDGSKSSTETETSLLSMDDTTTSTVEIQHRMEITTTVTDASTKEERKEEDDRMKEEEEEDEETEDDKESEEYDVEVEEKAVFGKRDMIEEEEEEEGEGEGEGEEDQEKLEAEDQTDTLTPEDTVTSGQQTDRTVKEMVAGADTTMQAAGGTDVTDFSSLAPSSVTVCPGDGTALDHSKVGDKGEKLDDDSRGQIKVLQEDDEEDGEDNEEEGEEEDSADEEDNLDENADDEFEISFSAEDTDRRVTITDDTQMVRDDVSSSDVITEISSEDQVTREYSDDFESDDDDDDKLDDQSAPSDRDTEKLPVTFTLGGDSTNEEAAADQPQVVAGSEVTTQDEDDAADDAQETMDVLAELDAATKSMGDLNVQDQLQETSGQVPEGGAEAGYLEAVDTEGLWATPEAGAAAFAGEDTSSGAAVFVDRKEETLGDLPRPSVQRYNHWASSTSFSAEHQQLQVVVQTHDSNTKTAGEPDELDGSKTSGDQDTADSEAPRSIGIPEQETAQEEEEKEEGRYLSQEDRQRYELQVQMVLTQMRQIQVTLTQICILHTASNLDLQMEQYEETIQELQSIRKEMEELSDELGEGRGKEEEQWVHILLAPIVDLHTTVQTLAVEKGKELQDASVRKSELDNAMATYMRDVCYVQGWVTDVQDHLQVTSSAQLEGSCIRLKQLLQENKALQASTKLKLLEDLETRCAELCQWQLPEEAQKLTSHLSTMTSSVQRVTQTLSQEENRLTSALKKMEEEEGGEQEEKEDEKAEEEEEEEYEEKWSSEEEIGMGVVQKDDDEEEEAKVEDEQKEEETKEKEEKQMTDEKEEIKMKEKLEEEEEGKRAEDESSVKTEEKQKDEEQDEGESEEDEENDYIEHEDEWLSDDEEEEDEEEDEDRPKSAQQKIDTQTTTKDESLNETDYAQRMIPTPDTINTTTPDTINTMTPDTINTTRTTDTTSSILEEGKTQEYSEQDSQFRATEATADTTLDTPQTHTLERTSDSKTDSAEQSTLRYMEEKTSEGVEETTEDLPQGRSEEGVPETTAEGSSTLGSAETELAVTVLPDFGGDAAWRTVEVTNFDPSTVTLAEQKQLQLNAATDLKEHQKLVQQISTLHIEQHLADPGAHLQPSPHHHLPPPQVMLAAPAGPSEEETQCGGSSSTLVVRTLTVGVVQEQWETAHRTLQEESATLDHLLHKRQAGEMVTVNTNVAFDSTQMLADVGSSLSHLSETIQQTPLQTENKELQVTGTVGVYYQTLTVVRTLTVWLTSVQRVLLMAPRSPHQAEDHLRQIEALQRELQQVQGHITLLRSQTESLPSTPPECAQTQHLALGSLTCLHQWVSSLELEAVRQHGAVQQDQKNWQQYQSGARELRCRLLELRSLVKSGTTAAMPAESIASLTTDVDSWEAELRRCQTPVSVLLQQKTQLALPYLGAGMDDTHLDSVTNLFAEVHKLVAERRAALEQIQSWKQQYEKMLEELGGFLHVGETKLHTTHICAQGLADLQRQLNAHKAFFSDLQDHRAALDEAASLCDAATRQAHAAQHAHLARQSQEVGWRAGLRSQHLEYLWLRWSQLQSQVKGLQSALLQAEENLKKRKDGSKPSVGAQKNRIQSITQQQKHLQYLREQQLLQVLDRGRQLQNSVTCPELETTLTDLDEKWTGLDQQLQEELQMSESLLSHLQSFQADGKSLKTWMKSAKKRVEDLPLLKKGAGKEQQPNLKKLRSQAQTVLELRKELQNQEPLRARMVSSGQALVAHPQCSNKDTAQGLEQQLSALEKEWAQRETSITTAEQQVQAAQVQQVPCQEQVGDLQRFLAVVEKALHRDAGSPLTALSDLHILLKKCKVYRVELDNKQPSMDSVRASLQQTGAEGPHPSQDTQKYADTVTQLDHRWTTVCAGVDSRQQHLETLSDQWSRLDTAVTEAQKRLTQQEKQLSSCRHPTHTLTAVLRALQDCKAAQHQLQKPLTEDIQHAHNLGENILQLLAKQSREPQDLAERKEKDPHTIQQTLQSLDHQQKQLLQEAAEVEKMLEGLLRTWQQYEGLLHGLTLRTIGARQTLDGCSPVGPDLKGLAGQVERLQTLQQELKAHSENPNTLATHAATLSTQHQADAAGLDIHSPVTDMDLTWQTLTEDVAKHLALLQNCWRVWREREALFGEAEALVRRGEEQCKALVSVRVDTPSGAEDSLKKCEALQQEVKELQDKVSALEQHPSEDLTQHMGASTLHRLTSRLTALKHRLQTLQQLLSEHARTLQKDLSELQHFQEGFAALQKFVEHAGGILAGEDPRGDSEESRLLGRVEELRELLGRFEDHTSQLSHINTLGHLTTLASGESSYLLDLNYDWHQCHADCQGHCRSLQGHLLARQTFSAKCQSWLDILASAEALLALPMAGDLSGMLEQQGLYQTFQNELPNSQQTLHALVTQGQTMMERGQVEKPSELQHTLQSMLQQWQNTASGVQQRKALLDSLVQQWQTFQAVVDRLRVWLEEKEEYLMELVRDRLSLQQAESLGTRVTTIRWEFNDQEPSRQRVEDLAGSIASRLEGSAVGEVRGTNEQVQTLWNEVFLQTVKQSDGLLDVDTHWSRSQELIETILRLLKERREVMTSPLPESYGDLLDTLHRHKEFSTSILQPAKQLEDLRSTEASLKTLLHDQDQDMEVLHQRVLMVGKLWDEALSLSDHRGQELEGELRRWTNLEGRLEGLRAWMGQMERKVEEDADVSESENLLKMMDTEYAEVMRSKGREVEEVTLEGRRLVTLSDEVRAAGIEHQLQALQYSWHALQNSMETRRQKVQHSVESLTSLDRTLKETNQWMSDMEHSLNSAIVYRRYSMPELHAMLKHAQELQEDIKGRGSMVASVDQQCESLLDDPEACSTQAEVTTVLLQAQKTTRALWSRIAELAAERTAILQETERQWGSYQSAWDEFSTWLGEIETEVDEAKDNVSAVVIKDDVHKYETLRKKLLSRLKDLDSLNQHYHRLVQEGRRDTQGDLQEVTQQINDRWDTLQHKVTQMLQDLRQSADAYEDFLMTQRSVVTWLKEVDVKVTDMEHLTSEDLEDRLKEIQRLEEELVSDGGRLENVREGGAVVRLQMSREGGERVQQAVGEMDDLYTQVTEHAQSFRQLLLSLIAEKDQSKKPPAQSSELRVDQSATLPPDSPPYTRHAGAGGTTLPQATVTPIPRSPSQELDSSVDTTLTTEPAAAAAAEEDEEVSWEGKDHGVKVDVLLEQLEEAVREATEALDEAEPLIHHLPAGATLGETESQSLLQCKRRVDKVYHLHQLLKQEAGTTTFPAMEQQVQGVADRWERLQWQVSEGNLHIPKRQQSVSKFSQDVDALLGWVEEAEALQDSYHPLPSDLLDLKVLIRQQRDFMAHLEEKRPRYLSIQLLSSNYVDPTTPEGRNLQARVKDLEHRWERVCCRAEETQQSLQSALLQCQEFHHRLHDHLLWLEGMEGRVRDCEPLVLTDEASVLRDKCDKLKAIYTELEEKQPAVLALKDTVDQLLAKNETPEMTAARDRMYVISTRLQALLQKTAAHIRSLEAELGVKSSSTGLREGRLPPVLHPPPYSRRRTPFSYLRQLLFGEEPLSVSTDETDSAKILSEDTKAAPCTAVIPLATGGRSLWRRVLWAALPVQLLLLMLLGIACLLPLCDDDECLLINNFRRSLYPMLHYYQGTPPM